MITSMFISSSTLRASLSGGTSLPTAGALPPVCEVVKNTGSITSKSRSACMRCISTEPTMPRQPIKPTRIIAPSSLVDVGGLAYPTQRRAATHQNYKSAPCGANWQLRPRPNTPRFYYLLTQCRRPRVAHRGRTYFAGAFGINIARSIALRQHFLHGGLDAVGQYHFIQGVAQHHCHR